MVPGGSPGWRGNGCQALTGPCSVPAAPTPGSSGHVVGQGPSTYRTASSDRRRADQAVSSGPGSSGPAVALTGISGLHVLCPRPTADAERAAADLARRGGGVSTSVWRLTDVAPAVTRVLSA